MTRALWFFVKLAILIGIAIWLVERPGTVTVDWQGYIVQVPFGFAVLGLAVAIALAALIYRFWRGVRRAPGSFGRWRGASRRDRGYRALTKGMVAVAAGDAAAARRFAREADNFLHDRPLTMLLSAQAAQLSAISTPCSTSRKRRSWACAACSIRRSATATAPKRWTSPARPRRFSRRRRGS
jgi:HemY protein